MTRGAQSKVAGDRLRGSLLRRIVWGAGTGIVATAFRGWRSVSCSRTATRPKLDRWWRPAGAIIYVGPIAVKEFVVRELGTNDKPVLLGDSEVVVALSAGLVARPRRTASSRRGGAVLFGVAGAVLFGVAGTVVFGAAGVAAALSRPAT
jgi:hypothetical protein